jgi:TP901 family phage tail tape measure protein
MAVNLGTAFGMVKIDASGVTAGMQTARESFDSGLSQIGPGIQNIGNQMSSLGGAMAGMTAPLAGAFAVGTKQAMDFDSAVRNSGAALGLTSEEVDTLKDNLLTIGGNSVQGPQAVATAFYDIAGGVADASTHMDILKTALDVSVAGSADLGGVVTALTKTMNIYGLSAKDASRAGDMLTRAVGVGQGTMDQFAAALPEVESQARALGISFEDVGGYMAYMSTKAGTVSQGATQLRGAMSKLMNPSKELGDAILSMGFQSGESMVKQLGLVGALNKIKEFGNGSFAGLITDQEALNAALLLTADGADAFFKTYQDGIDGATAEAKAAQMEGDLNKIALAQSKLSETSITMGGIFAPVLVDMANAITPLLEKLRTLIKDNPGIVKAIGLLAAGGAALAGVFMVLGPVISGIGAVLGVLLSPIGLIIAAVAGLFLAFQNNFLGIRDLLQPVIDWISSKFAGLIGSIQNFGQNMEQGGIGEAISSVLANILQFFGGTEEGTMSMARNIVDGFINVFTSIVDFVQTTVIPGIQTFFTFLGNAWAVIGPALANLANWFLTDVLPQVVGFVTTVVIPAVQSFIGYLGSLWAIVSPALGALADWFITSALPAITSFISDTVLPAIQQFALMLLGIWEAVKPGLLDLADWFINTALPSVVAFINDTVIPGVQGFIDILAGIWTTVQPVLQQLFDWFITNGIPFIQTAIQGVMDNFITPLINLIAGIWTTVSPVLQSVYDWFITNGIPFIQTAIQGLMDNFITPLINLLAGIWDGVKTGIDNFKSGIESAFNWVRDNVIKPVSDAIGTLINTIATADLNPFDSSGVMLNPFAQGGLFNRDSGGMGQPGQPYLIGAGAQPELFVPSSAGRFYPNADRLLGGRNEENGMTLNVNGITIHANSASEGRAAAEGFEKRLSELIAARGGM